MIPVLIGIIAITLTLFYVVSSDPVLQHAGRNPSEETLQALRDKFELNAPLFYSGDYLTGEDILKARRTDRVRELLKVVQKQIDDHDIENEESSQAVVDLWRDRDLVANDMTTINEQLARVGVPDMDRVDFSDIRLSESDVRKVAKRH